LPAHILLLFWLLLLLFWLLLRLGTLLLLLSLLLFRLTLLFVLLVVLRVSGSNGPENQEQRRHPDDGDAFHRKYPPLYPFVCMHASYRTDAAVKPMEENRTPRCLGGSIA
jgi:fatty acid desaturase